MNTLNTTLKELGFSKNESSVYLALTLMGEAKGSAIAKKVGLSRTTTLSILERLARGGFITSHKFRGTIYYWVESPAIIKKSFENKVLLADNLATGLGSIYRASRNFPSGKVFDTKESIKSFTEKLLLATKATTIYTIDSPHEGNYEKIFSDGYYKMLLGIKNKRSIATKTLIPNDSKSLIDPIKLESQNITIRQMPKGLNFEASVWLIGDTMVVFSGKPPFAVSLKHGPIVNSFKGMFSFLWNLSE